MTPSQPNPTKCPHCGPDCPVGYGFCHCRCGQKTNISPFNSHRKNGEQPDVVAGQPRRYIRHHQCLAAFPVEFAAPFKIDGVYCRLIPLGKGFYAIVDEDDYVWLMQWKWYARPWKGGFRVVRNDNDKNIFMHRQILELVEGDGVIGDHRSCIALDNRRKNLRTTDRQGNAANSRCRIKENGLPKGVVPLPRCITRPYGARINANGKFVYLGTYATVAEAHAAYCRAAVFFFGEFARFE